MVPKIARGFLGSFLLGDPSLSWWSAPQGMTETDQIVMARWSIPIDGLKRTLEENLSKFDGGGEREGMVGIEGIVVGTVGSGIEGNGGSVTFGAVGKVGSVGFGKDGIWVVGKGGNVAFGRLGNGVDGNGGRVALGRVGCVGSVGNGVDGNGGRVALGRVGCVGRVGNGVEGSGGKVGLGKEGTEGNGGKVAFGRGGIVGRDNAGGGAAAGVSKRWRAALLISKLCKLNAARKDNRKQYLKGITIVYKEIRKRKL
ncbi:hypothetical protein EZV62_014671 [Acer yangbiense]|uniref:Uncharacterized protein n=1 Tax=Acer yangbiense TaxID=1000413 RepID=A0A5C7HTB0_9ROSI|nr:hypothetical protein EZV62_014671 [Acer yangbiense]